MMASDAEVTAWDEHGAVTCCTPLCDDPDLLRRVQANMLRKFPRPNPPAPDAGLELEEGIMQRGSQTLDAPATSDPFWSRVTGHVEADCADQALVDVAQHPWFEETAKKCLRADHVRFCAAACACTYPQPGVEFRYGEHVDIQYTQAEWEATPRRVILSFFIWLADANARRAPLMHRPGSHHLIAAENSRRLALGELRRFGAGLRRELARTYGVVVAVIFHIVFSY
jgi:hypothetical protein